ncbi:MAG: response regulator [Alphaproteobacteria bacterium]|nr:response regulator [Alphaproteobacteria bacterium]
MTAPTSPGDQVNVLLVDDQPGKLLSYEVMLGPLGENLIKASSAKEALEHLLKSDVAVILVDVCMPELDGFELARMIREHPRFERIAIIFISAIHVTETDYLKGYDAGAVDYVPVPVVPEVLRAKVKVFAELYRKTRELEHLNRDLEKRVFERTAALEASSARLLQSEQGRSLALAAGDMGSWSYEFATDGWSWDEGHRRIFGVDEGFALTDAALRRAIHPDDIGVINAAITGLSHGNNAYRAELRIVRPNGEIRWCAVSAVGSYDGDGQMIRVSGVTTDITDRKDAEIRQNLLAREVDHRARNALAIVQAIIRLARADTIEGYVHAIEGRIRALAQTHELLSQSRWQGADVLRLVTEEIAPYRTSGANRVTAEGPSIVVAPETAQSIALTLHELATNAAKYGALSAKGGELDIRWTCEDNKLVLDWSERGGPKTERPSTTGFGMKIIQANLNSTSKGRADFDWQPEGLRCRIAIPCGPVAGTARIENGRAGAARNGTELAFGKRILLVEDEALIGILIHDMLRDWGFEPSEPYFKLDEAIAAARHGQFDGAILDMNLGGEAVYPLAELLERQSVPFVFLTGYGQHTIDKRFEDYPMLQKPVAPEALKAMLAGTQRRPKVA